MSEKKNWRVAMDNQRKLKKKGAEVLYDRVALCIQCYGDDEFREWCDEQGTNEIDYLDDELSDTAASFLTLRAVMEHHPKKDEWVKHNIRDLIAVVLSEQKKQRKDEGDSPKFSWKERAIKAERECEALRMECERLRAEVDQLKELLGIVATGRKG